ncbi:MAG TPA: hypothetical protein VMZ30_20065, partial [Pyrinomonadaceae bacterium]|nr:hypothetical protein [Pyrinomonadaceae bacterium]
KLCCFSFDLSYSFFSGDFAFVMLSTTLADINVMITKGRVGGISVVCRKRLFLAYCAIVFSSS